MMDLNNGTFIGIDSRSCCSPMEIRDRKGAIDCQLIVDSANKLQMTSGAPSQLFLPQAQPISRVSGFYPKKSSDEEEDGFIMQAASTPSVKSITASTVAEEEPTTTMTTTSSGTEMTTTISTSTWLPSATDDTSSDQEKPSISSGADHQQQGSIPIDANRQQFLTHDQLNLNASTKDEMIASDLHRVQSSRADRSKVSHVSSFLSELFSYATRARQPISGTISQHSNEDSERYQTNNQKNQRPTSASTTPATCPGICRSILTASLLCRNEVSAPCPSLLQKCCDTDDVSFNGTPVETSAPLTPPDSTDPNPAPLPEQTGQNQNNNQDEHQTSPTSIVSTTSKISPPTTTTSTTTTIPTTTTFEPSQQRLGPSGIRAGDTGSASYSQQSALDYLLGSSSSSAYQPATVYFLSSGNGSISGQQQQAEQQQQLQLYRPGLAKGEGSVAQSANDGKQQHSASQSFDPPLNEQVLASDRQQPSNEKNKQQVVVVQTANGTIVHHQRNADQVPKPTQLSRRPAYANWTDYHLSIMQTRPSIGQTVVYHSNIDPVKKFAEGNTNLSATLQPLRSLITTTTTTTTTTESVPNTCSGVCMRKTHIRSCLVAAINQHQQVQNLSEIVDLRSVGCSLESDEFCCLQTAQVSITNGSIGTGNDERLRGNDSQLSDTINGIRRTMLLPSSDPSETRGIKVMNDQHSASRDPSPRTQSSSQAITVVAATTTTSAPLTTTTESPSTTANSIGVDQPAVGLFGHVLGELFDSFMGSSASSSQQTSPNGQQATQADDTQTGYATDPVVSFAESPTEQGNSNRQLRPDRNDHRLGYDLSFRQQAPQSGEQTTSNRQQTGGENSGDTASDLMTSEGDIQQQPAPSSIGINDQIATSCAGYCTLPLFTMLCDRVYLSTDCGPSKKCCIDKPISDGSGAATSSSTQSGNINEEINDHNLPTVTTAAISDNSASAVSGSIAPSIDGPESACRGSCLPIYHSSLCTKPNELDSLGCLPNQVCCQPPSMTYDQVGTTNQLDDSLLLVDNMMTGASGPSPGLDTSGKQTTSNSPNSLYASLLPPPPPPVAQSFVRTTATGDINGRVPSVIDQQQSRQRQGHVALPSIVDPQTRILFTQQPLPTTTSRPPGSGKTAQSGGGGGGFINQIYQMFKSNNPTKQRQKNQQQQQNLLAQAHVPSFNFIPAQIDPSAAESYLVAHQYHQQQMQQVNHALHRPTVQNPTQLIYQPVPQVAANVLMANGGQFNSPTVNNYQISEIDSANQLHAQQAVATASGATRNRVHHPQQHLADQHQQFVSGHQILHQQQDQRPFIVQSQQQAHQHRHVNSKIPHYQQQQQQQQQPTAMNSMSQFNEQNDHLFGDKFAPLPQQSSERNPTIVSFINGPDGHTKLASSIGNFVSQAGKIAAPVNNQQSLTHFSGSPVQQMQTNGVNHNNNERRFQQLDNAQLAATINQQKQLPSRQQQQQHAGNHHQILHQPGAMQPFVGIGDASGQQRQRGTPFVASPAVQPVGNGGHHQASNQLPSSIRGQVPAKHPSVIVPSAPTVAAAVDHKSNHLGGPQVSRESAGNDNQQTAAGQLQPQVTSTAQQNKQPQRQHAVTSGRPMSVSRSPGSNAAATADQVNGQQPVAVAMSSVSRGGLQQPAVQYQPALKAPAAQSGVHLAPQIQDNNSQIRDSSSERRQSAWQQVAADNDDLNPITEQQQQPAPCPASCLAPLLSFNCVKPNYIDHNLLCPTNGAVCCVKGQVVQEQLQQQAVGDSLPQYQNSSYATTASSQQQSTLSMVTSNKLDALSLSDQDDQMDEISKQQQTDSATGDSVVNPSDLDSAANQQPPIKSNRPSTCGTTGPKSRAQSGRVMGGSEARPGHWCWQAALMNSENEYLCGGALIGSKWVLTAAHCVTQQLRSESQLYVRLGQHNLNSSNADSGKSKGQNILVKTTYVHHNHNGITLDNDIALLRLDSGADLDDPAVCTVCLPERSSQVEPGKRCTVTGYGFEDEQGPAALRVRQTDLPIVADQECQRKTSEGLGKTFSLPANSFCAGGELGQDACHGDGGSPLSCLVNGYYELTGIVSWGYKCGSKDLPGLYSKVSTFVGWINQIVSVNN